MHKYEPRPPKPQPGPKRQAKISLQRGREHAVRAPDRVQSRESDDHHGATPDFETRGVGLVWNLRVESTVQRHHQQQPTRVATQQSNSLVSPFRVKHPWRRRRRWRDSQLLEELGTDQRGTALMGREKLPAETFEIAVALRVYGAPVKVVGKELRGLVVGWDLSLKGYRRAKSVVGGMRTIVALQNGPR